MLEFGRSSQGIDAYLGAVGLAAHQCNTATFEEALVGMGIWEEVTTQLMLHVGPETPLAAAEWRRLSSGLSQRVPASDRLVTALQDQVAFDIHSLPLSSFHPMTHSLDDNQPGLIRLLRWTGLTAREKRIYSNVMGSVLNQTARGEAYVLLPAEVRQPTAASYILGETSWTATAVSSPYERYAAAFHLLRPKISGLATFASLMEYEKVHGGFPETLAQMRESGLSEPPEMPWSRSDYKYRKTDKGFDLLVPVPIEVMAQFAHIPGAETINSGSNYAGVTVEGYRFRYRAPALVR